MRARSRPLLAAAGALLWLSCFAGCQLFSGIDDLELGGPGAPCSPTKPAAPPGIAYGDGCTEPWTTPCQIYCCETVLQACDTQFTDGGACRAVCETWPAEGSGNTLACRNAACSGGACIAAGPAGEFETEPTKCGDACENFCLLQAQVCGFDDTCGLAATYASFKECQDECKGYAEEPFYQDGILEGDTYTCRLGWLVRAAGATSEADHATFCENSGYESVPCD